MFDNRSLVRAISDQPDDGDGLKFEAVVLPIRYKDFQRERAEKEIGVDIE